MQTGLFRSPEGKSYALTFTLVSSLFLLWGFCNGMIDVMDKHFQKELHLSLSQSAWVQFAHYLGYFLMAMPAGWLASKLGYRGGIIAGLLMVAVGGFWFLPATKIATFPAFLFGVCLIASGLTFLETVANPYTTVLGPKQFAATRINLAQSCNGVGWIFGPIAGAKFFYSLNAEGQSTGSQTLWIPYAAVGVVVVILAVLFFMAPMPDVKSEDEFHVEDNTGGDAPVANRGLAMGLLWFNIVVLSVAVGMIITAFASIYAFPEGKTLAVSSITLAVLGTVALFLRKDRVTNHSIWSHPHFSGASLTQFFYVAAQCGIFAYFINYMTSQIPAVPESWKAGYFGSWFEMHKSGVLGLSDAAASKLASLAFFCFLAGRVIGAWLLKKFPANKVLGVFACLAAGASLLVIMKLGWISAVCVFLSYLFMSIMFPTIFSLGIYGLGSRAKQASSFIVMAIMGGAIMPKLMGHLGDTYDISVGFIVPLVCFIWVAGYGFLWSKLSGVDHATGLKSVGGH